MSMPSLFPAPVRTKGVIDFKVGPQSRGRKWIFREVVLAVCMAHLCFLKLWSALLLYSREDIFFMRHPPSRVAVAGLLLNTFGLAALLWWGIRRARAEKARVSSKLAVVVLIAAGMGMAVGLSQTVSSALHLPFFWWFDLLHLLGWKNSILAVAVTCGSAAYAVVRYPKRLLRALVTLILILSPLVPVISCSAVWMLTHSNSLAFTDPAPAPFLNQVHPQRALWIIFDEWDQRLTFEDRPAGLALPEIDRFRGSALYASSAYPPGPNTIISVPSLLAGRVVQSTHIVGPADMQIIFAGSSGNVRWGMEPNILSRTRKAGFNIAVVGWYLPYCRVFNDRASSCSWMDMPMQGNSLGTGAGHVLANEIRTLFETNMLSPFGQSLSTAQQAGNYYTALDQAVAAATNPDLGLIFLHLPSTHVPYFFDRFSGRATRSNSAVAGYPDALALADLSLGRIRTAMEKAGLWDRTAILISSDHHFRHSEALDGKTDDRVPFLLKMPGQTTGLRFDASFNTVVSADLLYDVLVGRISAGEEASRWIAGRPAADLH